jgi:hypothetical protein
MSKDKTEQKVISLLKKNIPADLNHVVICEAHKLEKGWSVDSVVKSIKPQSLHTSRTKAERNIFDGRVPKGYTSFVVAFYYDEEPSCGIGEAIKYVKHPDFNKVARVNKGEN